MITSSAWLGSAQGSSVLNFEFDSDLFCLVKIIAFYMTQRSSTCKFNSDSDCYNYEDLESYHVVLVFDTVMFQILAFYYDFEGLVKVADPEPEWWSRSLAFFAGAGAGVDI